MTKNCKVFKTNTGNMSMPRLGSVIQCWDVDVCVTTNIWKVSSFSDVSGFSSILKLKCALKKPDMCYNEFDVQFFKLNISSLFGFSPGCLKLAVWNAVSWIFKFNSNTNIIGSRRRYLSNRSAKKVSPGTTTLYFTHNSIVSK